MVANLLPGIWILMSLSGILAADWMVRVPKDPVHAYVKSSVVLPCTFDYPESSDQGTALTVLSKMWCLNQSHCITPRYVYHSEGIFPELSYRGRVKFLGQKGSKNCSLEISDLRSEDSGVYVFRFITNHTKEKLPGQKGVTLHVILLAAASSSSSLAIIIVFGVIFIFTISGILICIKCRARRSMSRSL